MSNTLGTTGKRRLAEREAVIENGLASFLAIGRALRDICDERLYRDEHDTFDAYLHGRWGFSKSRAYQLMQALDLSTIVDELGALPLANEGQLRALGPVKNDRKALVDIIAKAHAEGDTSARNLTKYVAAYTPPEPRQKKIAEQQPPDSGSSESTAPASDAAPSSVDTADESESSPSSSGANAAPIDVTAREVHVHRCECGAEWHDADLSAVSA